MKYMLKYNNKGHDRASMVIEVNQGVDHTYIREIDETKTYLDCRHISASKTS